MRANSSLVPLQSIKGVQLNLSYLEAVKLVEYMSKTYFEPDDKEFNFATEVISHVTRALNGETT